MNVYSTVDQQTNSPTASLNDSVNLKATGDVTGGLTNGMLIYHVIGRRND